MDNELPKVYRVWLRVDSFYRLFFESISTIIFFEYFYKYVHVNLVNDSKHTFYIFHLHTILFIYIGMKNLPAFRKFPGFYQKRFDYFREDIQRGWRRREHRQSLLG